jgi:hypothetical protein
MRTRIAVGLAVVASGLVALAGGITPAAAQDKAKVSAPKHLYGHDLRVRPGGEREWMKAIKIGVELFHDESTKAIIAISESGFISVAKAPTGGAVGADKTCKWLTAHDLNCRKAGETEFTQKTKKWGVELFHDRGTNQLLYACESGSIALAPVPGGLVTERGPKWHHALEPRVRAPEQTEFTNAKKIGVEVFKDENTGGLIYITEVGAVATAAAPAAAPDPKKPLPPKTQYGLLLRVRGADESDFTEKTKQLSVEVFEDPNSGALFYLTESGFIATAAATGQVRPRRQGRDVEGRDGLAGPQGGRAGLPQGQEVRHRGVRGQPHRQPDLHQRNRLRRGAAQVS